MEMLIVLLGLAAGVLTTLAGAGGGVLFILLLSLLVGPHAALAASAPALLVGNVHRVVLYRSRVSLAVALPVVAGALPGSLIGGALVLSLPTVALRALFLVVVGYSVARAFGARGFTPPRALLAPAGALLGGVSATSGGAGLLLSPLLLSAGLTGESYVATSAAIAVSTHAGRLIAYGASGFFSRAVLGYALTGVVSIVLGNALGDRLRPLVEEPRRRSMVEHGTLALCATLAVLGFAR
jgi:uncharacterized protein